MKTLIYLVGLLVSLNLHAQTDAEAIFTYDSAGNILPKAHFIEKAEPAEHYDNITPYTERFVEHVQTGPADQYAIRLLRYKGWEVEGADFQRIEILHNGQTIHEQDNPGGWIYLPDHCAALTHSPGHCGLIRLNEDCHLLLLLEYNYDSTLPFLTLIALNRGKAQTVFQKRAFIDEVRQDDARLTISLQLNTCEYYDVDKPTNPLIYGNLIIRDGMIYYQKQKP